MRKSTYRNPLQGYAAAGDIINVLPTWRSSLRDEAVDFFNDMLLQSMRQKLADFRKADPATLQRKDVAQLSASSKKLYDLVGDKVSGAAQFLSNCQRFEKSSSAALYKSSFTEALKGLRSAADDDLEKVLTSMQQLLDEHDYVGCGFSEEESQALRDILSMLVEQDAAACDPGVERPAKDLLEKRSGVIDKLLAISKPEGFESEWARLDAKHAFLGRVVQLANFWHEFQELASNDEDRAAADSAAKGKGLQSMKGFFKKLEDRTTFDSLEKGPETEAFVAACRALGDPWLARVAACEEACAGHALKTELETVRDLLESAKKTGGGMQNGESWKGAAEGLEDGGALATEADMSEVKSHAAKTLFAPPKEKGMDLQRLQKKLSEAVFCFVVHHCHYTLSCKLSACQAVPRISDHAQYSFPSGARRMRDRSCGLSDAAVSVPSSCCFLFRVRPC